MMFITEPWIILINFVLKYKSLQDQLLYSLNFPSRQAVKGPLSSEACLESGFL